MRALPVIALTHTPRNRKSLAERLWARVEKTDGCWLWQGPPDDEGYGRIGFDGKVIRAHRAAWIVTNGPIPGGLRVLHTCDTPPCCRPDHLYLGTQAHNMDDRDRRGRTSMGPKHAAATVAGMKAKGLL